MLLLLFVAALASAAPLTHGERLEFAARWMGLEAGSATSTLRKEGERWVIEARARSAKWVEPMYPIDDWLRSEGVPGQGVRRYLTRFREGRFQQDQDMRFGPLEILVHRDQWFKDGWRSWQRHYPYVPGTEDPLSAIYRLRVEAPAPGATTSFPVFNGRRTLTVRVTAELGPTTDGKPTRKLQVTTPRSGDFQGRLTLLLSEDEDRVPMQTIISTRAGAVHVNLASRTVIP